MRADCGLTLFYYPAVAAGLVGTARHAVAAIAGVSAVAAVAGWATVGDPVGAVEVGLECVLLGTAALAVSRLIVSNNQAHRGRPAKAPISPFRLCALAETLCTPLNRDADIFWHPRAPILSGAPVQMLNLTSKPLRTTLCANAHSITVEPLERGAWDRTRRLRDPPNAGCWCVRSTPSGLARARGRALAAPHVRGP
jgi:hypothetical protein